ncbi:MAG: dUTP diphosphatase, partial [Shinella sp.]
EPGDRIAQLVVMPIARVTLQVVDTFIDSARGTGGFGHTGVR